MIVNEKVPIHTPCYDRTSVIFMAPSRNHVHSRVSIYGCFCVPVGLDPASGRSISLHESTRPSVPSLIPLFFLKLPHSPLTSSSSTKQAVKAFVLLLFPHLLKERQKIGRLVTHTHTGGRGGGYIIRLNDKKEQCCDSEQLVFPSVDRRCLCVCVRVRVCFNRLSCDCFISERSCERGVIDSICRGGKKKHDKWHSTKCPTSFPPSRCL